MGDRVEDRDYVVDAMRHDAVDEQLSGTHVKGVNVDEKEDSDDAATVRGAGAPPAYVELSSQFTSLEREWGRLLAVAMMLFIYRRARMAFIRTHASKAAVRQEDMRGLGRDAAWPVSYTHLTLPTKA